MLSLQSCLLTFLQNKNNKISRVFCETRLFQYVLTFIKQIFFDIALLEERFPRSETEGKSQRSVNEAFFGDRLDASEQNKRAFVREAWQCF